MNRDDRALAIFGGIGAALLIANLVFMQYEWWPAAFKVEKTITQGTLIGLVMMLVAYIAWAQMGEMRSRSPQILTENHRWSWNPMLDRLIPAGDFIGARVGGIQAMGLSMHGHHGTVWVHKDAFRTFGVNAFQLSKVDPTPFEELPHPIRRALRKYALAGPHHFGWAPSFIEARTKDFSKQTRQLAIHNRQIELSESSDIRFGRAMDQRIRILEVAAGNTGKTKFGRAMNAARRSFRDGDEEDAQSGSQQD